MYKILSVGRNIGLLLRRNDALALSGFHVFSPRTPEQTPYLAFEQHVDAIVIANSVDPHVRKTIIEAVRQLCPACLIVYVHVGETQAEPLADVSLDVTHDAQPLIDFLRDHLATD
jgi:hypothetical protein